MLSMKTSGRIRTYRHVYFPGSHSDFPFAFEGECYEKPIGQHNKRLITA